MNEQTRTFTENVNYITELDHSYGKTSTLHRSNIYLADSTTYDVVTTANIYNRTTMLTEHITVTGTLTASASTVLEHMLAVKSAVESAHPLVSYTYSYSTTIFGTLDASMVSVDPNIYVRTIECKISLASIVKFDLVSTVSDAIEIIPAIAMIDHTALDSVVALSNNTAEVLAVASDLDNVNIAAVNIASINTVASIQNIANITTVANDLNSMDLNGIADVTVVANDLVLGVNSSINKVSASTNNINSILANLASIDAVAADLVNIDAVVGSAISTAQDVVLTHADVVTTTAQVGIATTQAGLANGSAIAAALSATAAHDSELAAAISASSILDLTTTASNVAAGGASTAAYNPTTGVLSFGIPVGADGVAGATGATGNGIASVVRTSGTGSAGTTDTYTITYTDATTSTFNVYNGADGSGDMAKATYDTNNSGVVDSAESVLWSGISGAPSIPTAVSELTNDSGYITGAYHDSTKSDATHDHTGVYQPAGSYLTSESDPVFTASQANNITAEHITILGNTSGTNTGDQVLTDIINDDIAGIATTYSGYHTQALHEAQAQAIANLSGASASFYNNASVVIPETPAAFTVLTWTNNQASSNSDIFSLGTNEILFYKDGNYNFLSTLTYYRVGSGTPLTVTYELYDGVTNTTIVSYEQPIDMASGTKITVPMNSIINITGATNISPIHMKVRMQSTSASGSIELFNFNSIVVAQSIVNVADLETDPVFTAWDKSTGISITESQISNLGTSITMNSDIGTTVQAYSANTTTAGNTFNGVSQLVQTTAAGKLPAIDGSLLTNLPAGSDATKLPLAGGDMTGTIRGVHQAMAANDIAVSTADIFSKTISGATTLTVSSIPASPKLAIFVLELTNGGSSAVTWFANIRWDSGVAPTLTAAGLDIIVFYTRDGGANWRALVRKDSK